MTGRWQADRGMVAPHIILGALLGVLVLHPAAMVTAWLDRGAGDGGLWPFLSRVWGSFTPEMLAMTGVFAALGGGVGLTFALYHRALRMRERAIGGLRRELARDLGSIIAGGETGRVEFKSTARWDLRQQKVNRVLELSIARTVTALLNHEGGSLIIGVGDDGAIVGLQLDYETLKQQDRDGFQQFLMTLMKQRLGADACSLIHPTFARIREQDICRVVIEPAHRPVYLNDGGVARYFVRTGSLSREFDAQETVAHIALRWPSRATPPKRSRTRPV